MLLKIEEIAVSYTGIRALHDVSLEIKTGEIVALVGSNGAGKSTLVKTISGLLKPEQGTITFNGERIDRLPPNQVVRRGIAQVPEGRRIFDQLNVLENLIIGAYIEKDHKLIQEQLSYVYSMFPILKERSTQQAGTMSGGQQQMLAIGRALMGKPKLLMLDEPSMGIAPNLVEEIMKTLGILRNEGMTILLIEQAIQDALSIADHGYVLQTGRIVAQGTGQELLKSDMVRQAYLGM